jgi:Leucine Rich repeat
MGNAACTAVRGTAAAAAVATVVQQEILQALATIDIKKENQKLEIRCSGRTIDRVNARLLTKFLSKHPRAVERLDLIFNCFTPEAVGVFCRLLARTTLQYIRLQGSLGTKVTMLLSGSVQGNPSVKELEICHDVGDSSIAEFLQTNSVLTSFVVQFGTLGVEGARAMQPGIRGNRTLQHLSLQDCKLGDEGVSVIVDAILEANTPISTLGLNGNSITARGLRHMTRLLQTQPSSAVVSIQLDNNPGMFNNEEATGLFLNALRNTKMMFLSLNFCRLSFQAFMALFETASMIKTLLVLHVYDHVRLKGADRERQLEHIPTLRNISLLAINLDFANQAVLAAFHLNTSIRRLYDDDVCRRERNFYPRRIVDGPVFEILKRNRRLRNARRLLRLFRITTTTAAAASIPPLLEGLWAKAIEQLTLDKTGATAVYEIMQEKLIEWCAPMATRPAANSVAFCGCFPWSYRHR